MLKATFSVSMRNSVAGSKPMGLSQRRTTISSFVAAPGLVEDAAPDPEFDAAMLCELQAAPAIAMRARGPIKPLLNLRFVSFTRPPGCWLARGPTAGCLIRE